MMPKKDWETINDDWAEHDLAKGAQGGDKYP
jgi:mannosylglycoprotein endo-beta-mannosidase